MKKVYIYLAGPITGSSEDAALGWREKLTGDLSRACEHFVGISPLRCELPGADGMYPVEYAWDFAHSLTAKNKLDVARCDAVLAFLPSGTLSIGTVLEMGWAKGLGKTVVLVSDCDRVLNHPIIMADVPFRFDSRKDGWEQAIETIKGLFEVYT